MGIRVALGASKREALFESMRYWVRAGLAAMGWGMLLALALLPGMKEMLYATTPFDPVSFVATTLFLGGTLFTVIFLSARSVVSVDPIEALRVE